MRSAGADSDEPGEVIVAVLARSSVGAARTSLPGASESRPPPLPNGEGGV
jgi:hypothetical protein